MPLDASIPLRAGQAVADITPAIRTISELPLRLQQQKTQERQLGMQERRLGLQEGQLNLQSKKLKTELAKENDQQALRDYGNYAIRAKSLIDAGDQAGFLALAEQRQQRLLDEGRDPRHTAQQLQWAKEGNFDRVNQDISADLEIAYQGDILKRPPVQKESAYEKQLRIAGVRPGSPEAKRLTRAKLEQQGKPNTIVQLGAKKEAEKLSELRAGRYDEMQDRALAAEEQNAQLDALSHIDVQTGFGVQQRGQLASIINGLGGNGEALTGVDPANAQAFNAVTGKLVLDIMATQKGPQTDKDQQRIAKTLPTIANEQLANRFTLSSLKAINLRRIAQRDFYENYLYENETLKGADKAWSDFKQDTPMVSDQVKDPATGLPMFYFQFARKAREHNPNATKAQIDKAWRERAG
jgi:hypothetical protein